MRFLALALSLLGVSTASASIGPSLFSDSGFDGPPYETLVAKLEKLALDHSDVASVFTYGQTIQGRPMVGIRIQQIANPGAEAPLLVINGAIHGDEFLGIEDKLAEWLIDSANTLPTLQTLFAQGGAFVIIPVMNPDGYAADERENDHDVDLNRDFELLRTRHAASEEPETQAYNAFLTNELASSGRKLRFTLDYHCCIGGLLTPWAYGRAVRMDNSDKQRFNVVKTFAREILGTRAGTPYEVLGYTADGSTMDHFFEKYGSLSVAYEGKFQVEFKNLAKHTAFLERVVDAVIGGL